MTRAEKIKALQEMDRLIEHAGAVCASYELAQMEIMATVAKAKAAYKKLVAKKAELEKLFIGLGLRTARLTLTAARSPSQRRRA